MLLCGILLAAENSYSQARAFVEFEPLATVAVTPGHTTPVQFTFHVKDQFQEAHNGGVNPYNSGIYTPAGSGDCEGAIPPRTVDQLSL